MICLSEKKPVVILHEMSADEEMQELARLREKAIRDEISAFNFARRERDAELIAKMREEGFTEEQIRKIFK